MAQHIDSVAASTIQKVTKAQFYTLMRPGDLVFCWNRAAISLGIEKFTGGPSHVLRVWTADWAREWLTCEATIDQGVHYGRFSDYMDRYNGDLVLCRRPILTPQQRDQEMRNSVALIGEANLCAKDFRTGPYRKTSEATKKAACAEYGAADCPGPKWEVDHLISLEIGGEDALPNLWPQPITQARVKDHGTEDVLPKLVCSGKISLKDAQTCISGDWVKCAARVKKLEGQ